jgi:hypothetical protein
VAGVADPVGLGRLRERVHLLYRIEAVPALRRRGRSQPLIVQDGTAETICRHNASKGLPLRDGQLDECFHVEKL